VISFTGLFTEIVGAFVGAKFIQKGRRKTFLIGSIVILAGSALYEVLYFPVYLTGTAVLSFGIGFILVTCPRMIEETVPQNVYPLCMAIFAFSQNLGGFVGGLSASILPKDDDKEALEESNLCRFLLILQGFFAFIAIILAVFINKLDTPKWYLSKGKFEDA